MGNQLTQLHVDLGSFFFILGARPRGSRTCFIHFGGPWHASHVFHMSVRILLSQKEFDEITSVYQMSHKYINMEIIILRCWNIWTEANGKIFKGETPSVQFLKRQL
jgi:hypothetical protein